MSEEVCETRERIVPQLPETRTFTMGTLMSEIKSLRVACSRLEDVVLQRLTDLENALTSTANTPKDKKG